MSCGNVVNLTIKKGSTFTKTFQWALPEKTYKEITGITQAAPVVITAQGHDVPNGWPVFVTDAAGMTEINDADTSRIATTLTADTIELNEVNASGFSAYTSGGVLSYQTPKDLTGYTARAQIRASVGATEALLDLTTENGGISIDTDDHTVTLTISAADTAALDFKRGVYSLEMISNDDPAVVTEIAEGSVTVLNEVTR